MNPASQEVSENPDAAPNREAQLTLFALLWGVAALFHNLGPSGRAYGALANPTPLSVSQAFLSLIALWLIVQPRRVPPLVGVAVLGLVTAYLEAPQLGNHWLLSGFVDVGILLSLVVARRGGTFDRQAFAAAVLPAARWCLIIFYSFAAFAKLNPAFFDPAVSCGVFFFDETVRSYGLGGFEVFSSGLGRLIPIGAALTELSVPVLLIGRRTRVIGVVVGLVFHSVIALDRTHLFVDFSSLLAALFLTFMPAEYAKSALEYMKSKGRRLAGFTIGLALVVTACQLIYSNNLMRFTFLAGRMVVWYLFDFALVAGTVVWVIRNRRNLNPLEKPFALPGSAKFVLVPLLSVVLINGFFPYLELRTAYSYTMYSNLRMVDGKSNHFLVRASLPIGNRQRDPVRIVATSDAGLARYIDTTYELPWDTFRTYMAKHPQEAVTYERDGKQVALEQASDDPDLVDAPSLLQQKTIPLRAVDTQDPPRCQDVFLPAL